MPAELATPPSEWRLPFQALAEECGLPPDIATVFAGVREFLEKVLAGRSEASTYEWENVSDLFRSESPDEENRCLKEENARLRRALTVHGIPIPPLPMASPPAAKAVEAVPLESKEDRARKRIALSPGPVPRERRCVTPTMGEYRWPVRICTRGLEGLESDKQKPAGGPEEGRSEDKEVSPFDRHRHRRSSIG